MATLPRYLLAKLICPATRQTLTQDQGSLRAPDGRRYPILRGVPSFKVPCPDPAETDQRPEVSLLIMTRNEEECIASAILEAREVLDDLELPYEVLVVDGNSTDETVSAAQKSGAQVMAQKKPGYSAAFQEGLQACRGEYIVTIDADLSHDPNFIRSLWQARHSAEIVIGSRYISYGGAQMPRGREVMSRLLNGFLRRVLALPIQDLSSGLRLYHASAVQDLRLDGQQFDVLIELLARCCNEGYLAREVPFFYKPRIGGRSKVRLLKFAWAYLRSTLRLFPLRHSQDAADYEFRLFNSLLAPGRKAREKLYAAVLGLLDGAISDVALLGCGASKLVVSLPGAVCVDDHLSRLRFLRRTHSMLVHAHGHALPFADGCFGHLVVGPHYLSGEQSEQSAAELARVLRPGGFLILVDSAEAPALHRFDMIEQVTLDGGQTVRKLRKR